MKWIKLFENFTEENPSSIEIELTNELISILNKWGVKVQFDMRLNLKHNNNYYGNYNMIKIGTSANYDIQNDYWVSYHPDHNEIKLHRNITTKEDREYNYNNHKNNEIMVVKNEPIGKILSGRFETVLFEKFENGFKVGEIGDYFKIVGVEK